MSTSGAHVSGTPTGPASGDLGGSYPAPTVTGLQGRPVSNAAPTVGFAMVWNGAMWVPTSVAGATPATAVTGPDAFGAAAVVGASLNYARQDHDHGLPANPARTPAATVTGPDAFGAAPVVGASLLYARQDHDHGLPANPAPAFAVPAIVLGTAAAAGAAASVIRSDATVVAFDATVPVTQAFGDAAATGAAAVSARRDHRHGMPANPAPSPAATVTGPDAFGAAPVVGVSALYSRGDHDHGLPAAPTATVTTLAGSLGADVSCANGATTTIMSTASLAVGTWLVRFLTTLLYAGNIGNGELELEMVVGTATATFTGPRSTAWAESVGTASTDVRLLVVEALVAVTVAGTLSFPLKNNAIQAVSAKATTPTSALPGATGYTGLKTA